MKKDFLDELMDELQQLKDEQKKITISTPVAPHKVLSVINHVIKKHEITLDEKKAFVIAAASLDGDISPAELSNIRELEKCEE